MMKNLLHIVLPIILMAGCVGKSHNDSEKLALSDSLIAENPDSALKLLADIERDFDLTEKEQMHLAWNKASAHYRLGLSMSEDSLLLAATAFYKATGDSSKLLDGYLLKAKYLQWAGQSEQGLAALDSGLQAATTGKDTTKIIAFLKDKASVLYQTNQYAESAEAIRNALRHPDKMTAAEQYGLTYMLALNLSLAGDPASEKYYRQSADMAFAAHDTLQACLFMKDYAASLAGQNRFAESNNVFRQIRRIAPEIDRYSILQLAMTENFINLHQLDSAEAYLRTAWLHEQQIKAPNIARRGSLEILQNILNYTKGRTVHTIALGRFGDSITFEMQKQQKTALQQLETKNKVIQQNYELRIDRQNTRLWLTAGLLLLMATAIAIGAYIRNRYKRLAEAEERIDTLNRLLNEAQKAADDNSKTDGSLFKRLLLQQLGIVRLVANTPTAQNQALLKRIAEISDHEIPTDSLLVWTDLYPVIDKLYDNFYTRLLQKFGTVLTEKEIQICCLLRANFSTKEISVITQQTSATIYVRKTAIRKKISANEKQDIIEYISTI